MCHTVSVYKYQIKYTSLPQMNKYNGNYQRMIYFSFHPTIMHVLKLFLLSNFTIFVAARITFIIDFVKYKNLNNIYIFNSKNDSTVLLTLKLFNLNGISVGTASGLNCSIGTINPYSKIGIVLDTSCEYWIQVLTCLRKTISRTWRTWLIITDDLNSTANVLSKYPFEIDSDVTIANNVQQNLYELYEVYNTGYFYNGKFTLRNIGYWNTNLNIKWSNRRDLSGVVLKCVVVITDDIRGTPLKEYLQHLKPSKPDSVHKNKFFVLISHLKEMYNFTFNLTRTNSWGYLRNGSFDGLVGMLQRRKADIGGTPVFFRGDRAKYIHYTCQTWESRFCFILRHPKHLGSFFTIYTRPLTPTVWYFILSLLAILGITLSAMLKMNIIKISSDDSDSSTSLALLSIWSAVCQQGMSVRNNATSIKLLLFVTFVFTLTIYQYYNAVVVSTLLRDPPKNIKTLDDLLKSNLRAGVEDVLYIKDYFKRTTDPVALEMYEKKIATSSHYNFYDPERGMALVKRGGFAFHVETAIAYRIMRRTFSERELCEAHEVAMFPPQNMAAVTTKGSPYKEIITYGIRRMFESGVAQRLQSLWNERKPRCVRTPDTSVFTVSIREFSTALLVLGLGILLASLVLLCEIIVWRFPSNRV